MIKTIVGDYLGDLYIDSTIENNGIFQLLDKYATESEDKILQDIFSQRGTILDSDYIYYYGYSKRITNNVLRRTEVIQKSYPDKTYNESKAFLLEFEILPLLLNRFSANWKKKYVAITSDYNPINDYNEKETYKFDSTITDTPNTSTKVSTNTDTTQTTNVTQNANTFAFDSDTQTPTNANSGEQSITNQGNANNNYTETNISGNNTNVNDSSSTTERSGKHGSNDYSTMIEKELNLRKYNFYEDIYKDIDSIFTLCIY